MIMRSAALDDGRGRRKEIQRCHSWPNSEQTPRASSLLQPRSRLLLIDPISPIAVLIVFVVATVSGIACATGPTGCAVAELIDFGAQLILPAVFAAWYESGGLACMSRVRDYATSSYYEAHGSAICSPVNYQNLYLLIQLFRDGVNVLSGAGPNCGAVDFCEYSKRLSPAKPDSLVHCFSALLRVFVFYAGYGWKENYLGASAPQTAPICY